MPKPEQAEEESEDTLNPEELKEEAREKRRPPTPAPRRSVRSRKQPLWVTSEDYVMSHQLSSADGMKSAGCAQQKLDTDSLVQILPWKVTAIIRILSEKD